MSTRTLIRELRKIDLTTAGFMTAIREHNPELIYRTPLATLEKFVMQNVRTAKPATLVELLKMAQRFIQTPDFKKDGTNISNTINRIRNELKTRFGPESKEYAKAKKLLYFTKLDMIVKDQKYNAKIDYLNENPIEVNKSSIDAIMNDTRTDIPGLVTRLQLSSGARSIEILKIGNFKATGNNIEQKGVSNKTVDGADITILKPLILITADEFNREFKQLRELLLDDLGLTNEQMKNKYIARVTKRLKVLTAGNVDKSHTLRKLYGAISFEKRPDRFKKWSHQKYLSFVLGHSNMNTARVYSTIMIVDDTEEKKEDEQVPRNTKNRDGLQLERLAQTVSVMKKLGIRITVQKLKDLGYGSQIINDYRKKTPW